MRPHATTALRRVLLGSRSPRAGPPRFDGARAHAPQRSIDLQTRNRILREAGALESLEQINDRLLPELARLTHASFVFAYRGLPEQRGIRAYLPPSTPDLVADYFAEYVGECPLHKVKDKIQGSVVPTTALYGLRRLEKTRVYNELWRPWGFDHHVALRFDDPKAGPGLEALGVMVNRDQRRGEYSPQELEFLRGIVPSLRSAMRRAAKNDQLSEKVELLEALFGAGAGTDAKLVIDARGALVHAHVPAGSEAIVDLLRHPRHPVRLATIRLIRAKNDEVFELEHHLELPDGDRWRASLQLIAPPSAGKSLVIVTLSRTGLPLAASWGLTRSERAVLEQLLAGQTNSEIGRRLFISPETVRTHLTRIYKKLGARSRLEAVVKARLRGSA